MLIDSVVEAVFLLKNAEDLGFWRVLKKAKEELRQDSLMLETYSARMLKAR